MSTSAAVIGSTGLVGSHILNQLLAHPSISAVHTLTRRESPHKIEDPSSKLQATIEPESSTWPEKLSATVKGTSTPLLFSGLGTTRGAAGSVEAQRKIDLDLNLDLARAAKESGAVKTYVLISVQGANASSYAAYTKMKGELEDGVKKLGFEKTVILRPGLIVGGREKTRFGEQQMQGVAKFVKSTLGDKWTDFWAQDADMIARAAIRAGTEDAVWEGRKLEEGTAGNVWVMGMKEIVELGKVNKA